MKLITIILSAFLMLIVGSCSEDNTIARMEHIKRVGNENPRLALDMLDSLEIDIRNNGEYMQNKYDLLQIRLSDKADILPVSDIKIRKLVEYFEKEGTAEEKQEVYYYAGSVYRDLNDTPRALENFFTSVDHAKTCSKCDSIMLRNTFSNISYLQAQVQNYRDAASMAREEVRIAEELGIADEIAYMHLGAIYHALDSTKQAISAYDTAYRIILRDNDKGKYQEALIRLLCDYSEMHELRKASECIAFIEERQDPYLSSLRNLAFARFYEECGKKDSAIIFCNRIVKEGKYSMYNAVKQLFHLHEERGDKLNAYHYAGLYMRLSDSLDFGKRQELAATVNNAYKYHLDEKKERDLKEGKERYRMTLIIVLFASVAILSLLALLYIRRRNIHLKRVIELSSELKRLADDDEQLREEIKKKEAELQVSNEALANSDEALNLIKQEYERVNTELAEYDIALKEKESQLSEKIEQNKTFIKLLHQSELEGKAEDVILTVRQSATGKKSMTSADWKQLYQAVDELYPDFKDRLQEKLVTFTEQQMQVCYLMRIGLAKPQIQNLTNLSRVTVWRWVKKYDWII